MTKKTSSRRLTLREINEQLQILEYIATNTSQGLTKGDRQLLQELTTLERRYTQKGGAA